MKTHLKAMAVATSLIAGGLVSVSAHAAAYAIVTNNVQNGFIQPLVNNVLDFSGQFISAGTPGSTSNSSATLTGFLGVANFASGVNPDSPISTLGSTAGRLNETLGVAPYYKQEGAQPGQNFSFGDANVISEQASAATRIQARNIAESNIGTSGTNVGTADGTNASSTIFNLTGCSATNTCQLGFSFDADPYLYAELDALAQANPASFARGTLDFSVTLNKLNPVTGSTSPVFLWAPDGSPGGILGGTELLDPEALNVSVQALVPGTFDQKSGPYASGGFGSFAAVTDNLNDGTYTLTLRMNEKTEVKRTVPEPGTLAMLGLGLMGVAFGGRRKHV